MAIPFIDLSMQYDELKYEIDAAMQQVASSNMYIMGNQVRQFEEEFANFVGTKEAIGVGNGTDALVIALKAIGIRPGDEVITTPYTFFATAESIVQVGAKPVFVDVDERTFLIDVTKIEKAITKRTKAIMPVHIFGQCADMKPILEIAKKNNLKVIEDACQAVGASYDGIQAGTMGDIGCFSFYPTKNLGCMGDGGMIVTNQRDIAMYCRSLRAHCSGMAGYEAYQLQKQNKEIGLPIVMPKYHYYQIGYNSRLDEIQAAILRVKLRYLAKWNDMRIQCARYYETLLPSSMTPNVLEHNIHVYHLYMLQVENRETYEQVCANEKIETGIYYPIPLNKQRVFEELYGPSELLVAENLSKKALAIPMYPHLSKEKQNRIIEVLQSVE